MGIRKMKLALTTISSCMAAAHGNHNSNDDSHHSNDMHHSSSQDNFNDHNSNDQSWEWGCADDSPCSNMAINQSAAGPTENWHLLTRLNGHAREWALTWLLQATKTRTLI